MQSCDPRWADQARSRACESGRRHSERSAGPEESISSRARDSAIIARWAIMTPVGSPVVPEAQMMLYQVVAGGRGQSGVHLCGQPLVERAVDGGEAVEALGALVQLAVGGDVPGRGSSPTSTRVAGRWLRREAAALNSNMRATSSRAWGGGAGGGTRQILSRSQAMSAAWASGPPGVSTTAGAPAVATT